MRELKNVVERAAILSGDVITIADLPEDPHASPFDDEPRRPGGADAPPDDAPASAPREAAALPDAGGERLTLREYREQSERRYIVETLRSLEWNISRTAVVLGVERTNLHKKIRAYGIKRGETVVSATPVEPYPSAPRSVASSDAAIRSVALATGAMTS